MIGIGIDAVEVDRFRRVLQRTPRVVERLFSGDELEYARRRRDPTERLAARFAAKEAVMKALGVGLGAFAFRDVEVLSEPSGRPGLRVSGGAARLAEQRGVSGWRLSLTHTASTAEAVVVALD
jgi:holo-[acyl-carrier protein] synthase